VVDALRQESSTTGGGPSGPDPSGNVLESLIQRRLPQIVAVTGVVGFAALSFVGDMEDLEVLPGDSYKLALDTFMSAVAVSGVIAWFHGKKGRQKVQPLEVGLLTVVGIVWLLIGIWIILG
jgi:hypothetical protein